MNLPIPPAGEVPLAWPRKYDLFGVGISSTTYDEVVAVLTQAAKQRRSTLVDFTPVSVLTEAATNDTFRTQLNSFDLVCPDGQPVRWCLNHFHAAGLTDTVCGTTTTLRLCESAAREQIGVYLYGTTPETLLRLQASLCRRFPSLRIVGAESPPFRPLTKEEQDGVVDRVDRSGAGFVFIGIGSPNQERFVWEVRSRIHAVQLCVGAAFDFIAGTKSRAPRWVQKIGLEWMYRVCSEPARLGKRYATSNLRFAALLLKEGRRSSPSSRDYKHDVLVVAPGPLSRGGINAVVAMHQMGESWSSRRALWLETMKGGGPVAKLVAAAAAFCRALVLVPQVRLVHIHMAAGASLFRKFLFFALASLFNRPTVIHLHCPNLQFTSVMGGGPSLARTLCRFMLHRASRVVVLSDSWERLVLGYVPTARTVRLSNPYWLPLDFQAGDRRGALVLYLNRIESRKGYQHLLRAIPAVLQRHPGTRFVLGGHGEVDAARKIATELGIAGAVELLGWVEGDRKWRLLADADILCLPSFEEGVPITLLEAMAAGLAVVTTAVGGIPDVVQNDVNGVLVRPGDVSAIANALIRLLDDGDLRARLSVAARETVERMNSLAVVDRALSRLYSDVLDSGGPASMVAVDRVRGRSSG
jgi:N-acetylglucosaminyldiphosphoundecaprenol N-acetyl-beta-D-mannosaminyltransferase